MNQILFSFFSDASNMITGATICASIVAASVLAEAASIADDVHSIIIADEESVGEAGWNEQCGAACQ